MRHINAVTLNKPLPRFAQIGCPERFLDTFGPFMPDFLVFLMDIVLCTTKEPGFRRGESRY